MVTKEATSRAMNAFAAVGRVTIGLQGIVSIMMALILLVVGMRYLGTDYPRIPAIVSEVECEDDGCAVALKYVYKGDLYQGTLGTSDVYQYSKGDTIYLRINPTNPTDIRFDIPIKGLGLGMVLSALVTGFVAYHILSLVSDDRNVAALGGALSFLQLIFM